MFFKHRYDKLNILKGNTLNDLGDGCLDDLLNAPSDCIQQPSTSTTDKFNDKIESPAARTIPSVNSSSVILNSFPMALHYPKKKRKNLFMTYVLSLEWI